jgi:hypothetical protein
MPLCFRILGQVALALTLLATSGCSADKESPPATPQKLHRSFKGLTAKPDDFDFFGPDSENCVHFEPQGLRIKTSPEFGSDHGSTGIVYKTLIKGDFEITTDFGILREPTPLEIDSHHTRFTLDVVLDNSDELVALSRRVARWWQGGTQFGAYTRTTDRRTNQPKERFETFLTKAKTGRLRIARKGAVVSFEVVEGSGDEFRRLEQVPFDTGDVGEVRLVEGGGGPHGWLDARVTELTIRADALPAASTRSSRRIPMLAVGVVAAVMALLGIRVWYNRRQNKKPLVA